MTQIEVVSLEILMWFAEIISQSLGDFWVIGKTAEFVHYFTIRLCCSF